ncbi:MAG: hypothetical protein AB2A00_42470 [Myxococcota bacterium]
MSTNVLLRRGNCHSATEARERCYASDMVRIGLALVLLLGNACRCGPVSTDEEAGGADSGTVIRDGAVANSDGGPREAGAPDASAPGDAALVDANLVARDAGTEADGSTSWDAAAPETRDATTGTPDAAEMTADAATGDVDAGPTHVHISISNTCEVSISPEEVTVPADVDLFVDFHNHSADYEADVWMSYGGGYLELGRGQTWSDPIRHCLGPNPHEEYADISIAGGSSSSCPGVRFLMHCN